MIIHSEPDWNDLLLRSKQGNLEAQDELLSSLAVTLRPMLQCRLRGRPKEDLEDALQDTLLTFSQKIDKIDSDPHRYAAVILRNKIGDYYRRQKSALKISIDTEPESMAPGLRREIEEVMSRHGPGVFIQPKLEKEEQIKKIKAAIKSLSQFCKTFFLGILEDYDRDHLFELLCVSEPSLSRGTYRKRIFDCRQKLKTLITE